jgi:hypothetical protein
MPSAGGLGFALAVDSPHAARLARALEVQANMPDRAGFGAIGKWIERTTRCLAIGGQLRIFDGRRDPAFLGGQMTDPAWLDQMTGLELAGVDGVELPQSPAVDTRFGPQVAQPIVFSINRLRAGSAEGRVSFRWLP